MRLVRLTLIFAAAMALAILLLPATASADGITWTLNDVTLNDGGTVTGSFNYDDGTNTYSAINISSTSGSLLNGTAYMTLTPAFFSGSTLLGAGPATIPGGNFAGLTFLELMFLNPLNNAGGTDSVQVFEIYCANSNCSTQTERQGAAGTVVGAIATPEPSSLLLLVGGFLAITLLRRLI